MLYVRARKTKKKNKDDAKVEGSLLLHKRKGRRVRGRKWTGRQWEDEYHQNISYSCKKRPQ